MIDPKTAPIKVVSKRTQYHSNIKIAAFLGILPDFIKKAIPRQTLHTFMNTDYSYLFGFNDEFDPGDIIETLKEIARDHNAIKVYKAVKRIKDTVIFALTSVKKKIRYSTEVKEVILKTIERVKDVIGIKHAVKYFKISIYKYYSWLNQSRYQCSDSVFDKCFKVWPGQLTKPEVRKIKELCNDKRFIGWPIASIAYWAMRKKIITACLSTWYKYTKLLGITRPLPSSRRKKNKTGIRVQQPNQLWHADVTVFRTMDNIKAYIYLIIDNYSRFILAHRVALECKAKIMLDNLRHAIKTHVSAQAFDSPLGFMTDGGPENKAGIVSEFIEQTDVSIEHIIAQQDVDFSNSMIEAANKVFKYRYLYLKDIPDFEALGQRLDHVIDDYNYERPHISNKGLTPYEAYTGQQLDTNMIILQFNEAHTLRLAFNQQLNCHPVSCDKNVKEQK